MRGATSRLPDAEFFTIILKFLPSALHIRAVTRGAFLRSCLVVQHLLPSDPSLKLVTFITSYPFMRPFQGKRRLRVVIEERSRLPLR